MTHKNDKYKTYKIQKMTNVMTKDNKGQTVTANLKREVIK